MSLLRSWKTILGLLVVFVAGGVIGVVGTLGAIRKEYRLRMDPATWQPRAMVWLSKSAGLTSVEQQKIEPDVALAVRKMAALKKSAEMERDGVLAEMFGEILPKLTPEQQEKLIAATKAAAAKTQSYKGKLQPSESGRP